MHIPLRLYLSSSLSLMDYAVIFSMKIHLTSGMDLQLPLSSPRVRVFPWKTIVTILNAPNPGKR